MAAIELRQEEALHPYPDELHIVTEVGSLRDAEGGWHQALAPKRLRAPGRVRQSSQPRP